MTDKAQQLIADILNGVIFGATLEEHSAYIMQAVSDMTPEELVAVKCALETAIATNDLTTALENMDAQIGRSIQ